jgi:hypothetical protein
MIKTAVLLCALLPGAMLSDDQKKDPPLRYEGVVSSVDKSNPNSVFVTITVKEMMPTDREDVVIPVDKNYEFKLAGDAKFFGMDGKPDKEGLKSLARGAKVRVETNPGAEKVAIEIRILQPRG